MRRAGVKDIQNVNIDKVLRQAFTSALSNGGRVNARDVKDMVDSLMRTTH